MVDIVKRFACMYLYFTAELLCYNFAMSKKTKGDRNSNRSNGKAAKKHPKVFDPVKRRLVPVQ